MAEDLKLMLRLNETIHQLSVASRLPWNVPVLMREDGHVFRMVSKFEPEGQKRKGRPKRTQKKQLGE